jgi:hypothetical protein
VVDLPTPLKNDGVKVNWDHYPEKKGGFKSQRDPKGIVGFLE